MPTSSLANRWMCISMLKKSSLTLLFLGLTSCCRPDCCDRGICCDRGNLEIPYSWQAIKEGMTLEDPSCFHWWTALNDPTLTTLVMEAIHRNRDVLLAGLGSCDSYLKSMHDVSAEVAKNYVELRGLQLRLGVLDEQVKAQSTLATLNKDLSKGGFFDEVKENEDQKNLELLLSQQSQLNFSKEKIIFHLSTLVNYQPELLTAMLCQPQDLPNLCGEYPLGCPRDFICCDISIREARKQYACSGTRQALYNYQKVVLDTLESAETALAAFYYARDKFQHLENAKNLQLKTYQSTTYLNGLGLKDDREVLLASQELLVEEDALIQGKVDLLTSYIDLYRILSCGWET